MGKRCGKTRRDFYDENDKDDEKFQKFEFLVRHLSEQHQRLSFIFAKKY